MIMSLNFILQHYGLICFSWRYSTRDGYGPKYSELLWFWLEDREGESGAMVHYWKGLLLLFQSNKI